MKYINKRLLVLIFIIVSVNAMGYAVSLAPFINWVGWWQVPLMGIISVVILLLSAWLIFGLWNIIYELVKWVGKGSSSPVEKQ
tara:strand:+ start:424 stop:672 length:249 start_codon:yes stop_codon:yes gene_type:complete